MGSLRSSLTAPAQRHAAERRDNVDVRVGFAQAGSAQMAHDQQQ
jgi:hypothetical protein